jgi:hypothetical protein
MPNQAKGRAGSLDTTYSALSGMPSATPFAGWFSLFAVRSSQFLLPQRSGFPQEQCDFLCPECGEVLRIANREWRKAESETPTVP